ncbi:MAG TPA: SIS domain-containing protein [Terriglobia bacterium]|nr:SIS domain-containing protein [Terriglobia bacterium]
MTSRQQIQEIPGALRATLEKAHAEYGAVARKVRWGDGPINVCGAGDCAALGLAASYALEYFLGIPVVARPVEVFQSYSRSLLQPRSVLVMISARGEWPEAQELAREALERGCTTVAFTNTPDSTLVKLADHVFLTRAEGDAESPAVTVCMHAALNFLGFEAMRVLKKPKAWWELVEKEFDQLPEKLDWVFTQLPSAVRSAAAEVARFPSLRIVGGGFYHYPAWQAAHRMRFQAGLAVEAIEATEFWNGVAHFARRDDAILFLSGSQSKIKKLLHRSAAQARLNGAQVLSLTDSNDRDLAESSDLGILIPSLIEAPGCTLTMFMLEWLVMEARRAGKP